MFTPAKTEVADHEKKSKVTPLFLNEPQKLVNLQKQKFVHENDRLKYWQRKNVVTKMTVVYGSNFGFHCCLHVTLTFI